MAARKRKTVGQYIVERRVRDAEFAEEFDKLQLARKMKELREKAGLSQAQLAARVGTQAPGIARLESGRFAPRLDVLHRIAAALGKRVRIGFDSLPAGSKR
jgi:DNA-binding XRE family transcriptional regulator